jgi:endonuclease YncB( thermonuclease family)
VVALLSGVLLALTLENLAAEYGLGPHGESSPAPTGTAAPTGEPGPPNTAPPAAQHPGVPEPPAHAQPMVVRFVWDGDTVELQADEPGEIVTTTARIPVRLLGVDTPEIESQLRDEPSECHGDEAHEFVRSLIPDGTPVLVDRDRSFWDDFERRLLYVWTADGLFVNYEIVAQGYGEAIRVWPNVAYWDVLREAEADARQAGVGRWSACPDPD